MNKPPLKGWVTIPRDVMKARVDGSTIWGSSAADVRGLAVGANGIVILYAKSVEGISLEGRSLWERPRIRPAGALGRRADRPTVRGDAFRRLGRLYNR